MTPRSSTNFFGEAINGDLWIFTGLVTDVDDDPEGWVVDFFGELTGEDSDRRGRRDF